MNLVFTALSVWVHAEVHVLNEDSFVRELRTRETAAVSKRSLVELRGFLSRTIIAIDGREDDEAARIRAAALRLTDFMAPIEVARLDPKGCAATRGEIRRLATGYLSGEARESIALLDRLCQAPRR